MQTCSALVARVRRLTASCTKALVVIAAAVGPFVAVVHYRDAAQLREFTEMVSKSMSNCIERPLGQWVPYRPKPVTPPTTGQTS
jgi:hypothetical protein